MASTALLNVVMWSGLLSFAVANLVGLRKKNTTRMLGYSSVAQIGLIIASIAFVAQRGELNTTLGTMIIGGLLLNHLLAKAGLFWLLDALKFGEAGAVVSVGFRRISTVVAGIGVLALIALPPFPGFFGKWLLIMEMSRSSQWIAIALLLGGSIVEAAYLVRWLIFIIKAPLDAEPRNPPVAKIIPPVLTAALLLITGIVFGFGLQLNVWPVAVPLFCYALFAVLDFLPSKQKTVLLIVATIGAAALFFPHSSGFQQAFLLLFAAGGAVFALTGLNRPGSSHGYFPLLALLLLALIGLPASTTTLQFFTIWEFITIAVFFLILRGADARQAALLTLLFGIGGAACILTGFGVLSTGTVSSLIALRLDQLASAPAAAAGALLLLIGFLVKTGTLGVHIWLPGAYAESEDDFSAINSALVSKIGIYGILLTLTIAGPVNLLGVPLTHLLAWIGVVSALIGTLIAVFQEDIKYLLAYSSMGQLGLIVTAAAMNNHLGWVTAFYLSVNHLLFKGLLWIAFAGVVERTGTRLMYQMGGLIKRMPIAFIAVLMAIIALSGVPPLSGFGGKWLLYNGLIDQRWHLVAAVAFFASTIAFLYCFRLIHTVFLGQAKAPFKNSRDISRWLVAPIGILVMSVMAISSYPQLLVNPLARTMSAYFPPMLRTDGLTILTRLGYWNATLIMAVTMAVFALLLAVLLFMQRNIQKVKQFNIVYAAERPFLPETTHYAHNFFAPYQKALGFLVRPGATRFWRGAYEWCDALGGALRTVYTGNGQTYVLHLLLYVAIAYALVRSLP
jgi:formate hydrogenlyase subunit 3/multisubunit Na+/H+ antiporter MnhD subunit